MVHLSSLVASTWLIVVVFSLSAGILPARHKSLAALSGIAINGLITTIPAIQALFGTPSILSVWAGSFFDPLHLQLDGLSAWFIVIINLVSLAGVIYGTGHMKPYGVQRHNLSMHWIPFLVFHFSTLWVVMVQHSLAFLVMWEVMSVSSMLLVVFDFSHRKTVKAFLNYLVQILLGIVLLTIAFIWVHNLTGSWQFSAVAEAFQTNPALSFYCLFLAGFGITAGFILLHPWCPLAHPAVPSPVSGVMSGAIVAIGIYGIIRLATSLSASVILLGGEIMLTVSVITTLFGILKSTVHRDLKKMPAFCTIENPGIIGIAIGLGKIGQALSKTTTRVAGYGAALFHTLNHALAKPHLFFTAGNGYYATHTRRIDPLGGLLKKLPFAAFFFLLGALFLGGLPPFNGFISGFILYSGLIAGFKVPAIEISTLMVRVLIGRVLVGSLSLFAFPSSFGIAFLGVTHTRLSHPPVEVSNTMIAPAALLALLVVVIGLSPTLIIFPLKHALLSHLPYEWVTDPMSVYHSLQTPIRHVSVIFIFLVISLWLIRKYLTNIKLITNKLNRSSGNIGGTLRIQYTGKSFSKSLAKFFCFIVREKKPYSKMEPHQIAPDKRVFNSAFADFFSSKIIIPALQPFFRFFNLFQCMNNGRIQSYVLYRIVFIQAILAGSLLKLL